MLTRSPNFLKSSVWIPEEGELYVRLAKIQIQMVLSYKKNDILNRQIRLMLKSSVLKLTTYRVGWTRIYPEFDKYRMDLICISMYLAFLWSKYHASNLFYERKLALFDKYGMDLRCISMYLAFLWTKDHASHLFYERSLA
jgi:hypothetical protein